jgi:hypothetical protein
MAYTPIDKSDEYFNTVLYTGTGATLSITGVGVSTRLGLDKRQKCSLFSLFIR